MATTVFDQKGAIPNIKIDPKTGAAIPQGYTPPSSVFSTTNRTQPSISNTLATKALSGSSLPKTPGLVSNPSTPTPLLTSQPKVASSQTQAPITQSITPVQQVTDTHDALIKATEDKLKTLQGQLKQAQNAGYKGGEEIKQDTAGNIVSKQNPSATNFGSTVQGLINTSSQPNQSYKELQTQIQRNLQEQRDLTQDYAQKSKNIQGTAGFLTQATGLEGLLNRQYGLGQEALTQQQQGLANQLNAANTQQGLQQTGLTSAANLIQPTEQFGVKINPVTGQPIGGGTFEDLARQGGTIAGIQAGAQATASAGGNIEAEQKGQMAAYQSAHQQAKNLQNQLTDLISAFGLNPSDVNAVNAGIQQIAANVSDPRYKALNNYINDIASRYAQILTPTGGSQTDTTRSIAASMLDSTAKGASIINVLNTLDQQAEAVISGVMTGNSKTQSSIGNSIYDF